MNIDITMWLFKKINISPSNIVFTKLNNCKIDSPGPHSMFLGSDLGLGLALKSRATFALKDALDSGFALIFC